jgi:hypothetical protein
LARDELTAPKQDIDANKGQGIVAEAADWKRTEYAPNPATHPGAAFSQYAGVHAKKDTAADCSGSVWNIYKNMGLPYTYTPSGSFASAAATGHIPFRKVDVPREALQAGDVILYHGHMAIYAGKDANGHDVVWNAREPGKKFSQSPMDKTGHVAGVYRYQAPTPTQPK